jgi:hypothetical protein
MKQVARSPHERKPDLGQPWLDLQRAYNDQHNPRAIDDKAFAIAWRRWAYVFAPGIDEIPCQVVDFRRARRVRR